MKKVLITGSGGVIGSVLRAKLPYHITEYDLPDYDVTNYEQLVEACRGHDALINLAYDKRNDDWLAETTNPENVRSSLNVFEAAHQAGVKRVIMASSVHADDFVGAHIAGPLNPLALPTPDSPYGASKCMMEALGRYYAHAKDLSVVCIRLGGINKGNLPPEAPLSERQVWFSHDDCTSLITACLQADTIPNNYALLYGMSNNKNLIHDLSNPFNWQPQDSAQ